MRSKFVKKKKPAPQPRSTLQPGARPPSTVITRNRFLISNLRVTVRRTIIVTDKQQPNCADQKSDLRVAEAEAQTEFGKANDLREVGARPSVSVIAVVRHALGDRKRSSGRNLRQVAIRRNESY